MIAANRIVIFVLCYNRGGNHKGVISADCKVGLYSGLGISRGYRVGLEVFVLTYLGTTAQICVRIRLLLVSCKRCLLVF